MNYSKDEYGNVIISDGVRTFTFMNMGDYVGHNNREWYEEGPVFYKLMTYDEIHDKGRLHVEALVDTLGNYQRILVDTGSERRSFNTRGNFLVSDAVYLPEKAYVSFDHGTDLTQAAPNVNGYLGQEHTFTNENGETYEGPLKRDDIITAFINADRELLPSVNEFAKSEQETL